MIKSGDSVMLTKAEYAHIADHAAEEFRKTNPAEDDLMMSLLTNAIFMLALSMVGAALFEE